MAILLIYGFIILLLICQTKAKAVLVSIPARTLGQNKGPLPTLRGRAWGL
jgi:hypothetical protein